MTAHHNSHTELPTLMRSVPFVDLSRQHDLLADELNAAFGRVISRGSFTLGEEVDAFEREFAGYVGTSFSVGVGSGTDALHLALRALGVGPGDEVVTAVNTFAATAEAIMHCGARPVFVDVDESTLLMDPDLLESAITPRTKAVIPVHLHGHVVDMDPLLDIARRHGIAVVEDACQAHGASYDGRPAGSLGDAACFSFYPSKNLGALGDGGIVTTDREDVAQRVRLLRNHAEDERRLHLEAGYCTRLHGLQAALLRAKLPHLDAWNEWRARAAQRYEEALAGSPVRMPGRRDNASHVYHLYVVRVADRDDVRARLGERGIQSGIHYLVPLHLEPAFAHLGYVEGDFPVAERAAREMISIPMFPYIEDAEVDAVADALLGVLGHD